MKRLLAESRLLTEAWPLYDGSRVVYRPRNLTRKRGLATDETRMKHG
jgi:hypothetical protein